MFVFLNGQFLPEAQAFIPVNDRGFTYGDGLFETMRVVNGKPFRMAQHLERMTRGADFLRIKPPFTPKKLEKFAGQLIEQNQMSDAILRVTLTRGPGKRGYTPDKASQPSIVMTLHAAPSLENPVGWSLVTSSFRIPTADPLSSFKTTSKILHVMARIEAAEKGADEALLINTNGEVAETASGNLFWIYQDEICTVPTGRGVLPGITRAIVLEICPVSYTHLIGTLTSMAFQYGVPLDALVRKFAHQRFEPSGFTKNAEIRNASSITDYVFRWLALQFIPGYRENLNVARTQPELAMPGLIEEMKKKINRPVPELPIAEDNDVLDVKLENSNGHGRGHTKLSLTSSFQNQSDAPTCPTCGHVTVRNGACYKCLNCGESLGCS